MIFGSETAEGIARTVRGLVSIKSLSGEEAPAAAFVQAFLNGAGVVTQRDTDDNVWAVIEPLSPGEAKINTLHLSGHTDTVVPVAGWQSDPWKAEVLGEGDERRIVGLGASDMKSGIAVLLHLAAHFAKPEHRLRKLRLVVSCTICEEGPAHGKRNGVHRLVEAQPGRWALTAESSCDPLSPTLAVGCQGHAVAKVALKGRSAHSASPDRGLNAIYAAARICERVERLNRSYKEFVILDSVQARSAASVTLINGGSAGNIIPDHCELTVSRRVAPGETREAVEHELAELTRDLDGVSATWTLRLDAPACVVDKDGPLLQAASDASQQLFKQVRYSWNRARTDMVLFKQAGMDVINMGPGFTGQAHVAGEYVRVIDLPRSANLIAETVMRLDQYLCGEPARRM
jgi:succinyl-diaminopimelate desuccinylase